MRRKRNERMRLILCCGGAGILSGTNVTDSLLSLQVLARLKKLGLALSSGNVNLCSLSCDDASLAQIREYEKTKGDLLILKTEAVEVTGKKRKFGRDKKILLTKLIAAACPNGLSVLIGTKILDFKILSFEETVKTVNDLWTAQKENVNETVNHS